ncbi:uncharacterized protein L3040_008588 [Drepanopeziza brunnea f. sp. 'multigermtubi']|uniref:uncharacterized protein n=1 Tax=Drepanopeziza brunnea f. sp. 'multigermtubi' TaxID=698441 RepID=UPI0023887E55|nr:hypothetical protein L3040_008588 [Drepanopeziza brunnea f. sp. 'multigermtubi']
MHFSAYPLLATAAIITVGQALSITLNVNVDNKIQMMDGFGVSQALRKALNIERLPAQESAEVLDLLISQTIGAGLSIYRNGLGSSPDSSNGQMNSIQPLDPGGLDATPEYLTHDSVMASLGLPGLEMSVCQVSDPLAGFYATMIQNGIEASELIKIFKSTMINENLANVSLICCDAVGWKQQDKDYNAFLRSLPTADFATSKQVWVSDWADLSGNWTTEWDSQSGGEGDGIYLAGLIHNSIALGRVSAFIYGIGAEAGGVNTKLFSVDGPTHESSKRLWAMAHYSRAARPGAERVEVTGGNLKTTAYQNTDGMVSVVALNNGTSARTTSIRFTGFTGETVQAYITNTAKRFDLLNASINSAGDVTATIPAQSIETFMLSA